MKIRLLICALIATMLIAFLEYLGPDEDEIVIFYEQNLRGNLFAGFLTVGGFLLSLKTFILIKLKENVYDHIKYKELFDNQRQLDSNLKLYAPLENLSNFLFWSVLSTIGAAISQLTIGLFSNYWLTLVSLWLSVFAISVLVVSLILIKSSLNDWFSFINQIDNE